MQQHTEVLSYALSKLDKQLSQLTKKTARLKVEIEEGEKLEHLQLFCGSIGSLPLRVYVENVLRQESEQLAKKKVALEEAKKELDELQELKNNNPTLSAVPATKGRRS